MATPLRWGVLGASRINRRTLPGFRAAGQVIAIIGSRDRERARSAAAEHGAERFGTYEDVLAAPDVEAVYISLPNSLHAEWAVRAAEAGKHILCEKPLAPSTAECERMIAACARHGVQLVEAFMYRYHPQWRLVRDLVEAGTIGGPRLLRATFSFLLRDRANIRLSSELGGGALQDVGCYCVNVARWFLGEPTRVRGFALDLQGAGVDTHAAAVLDFPSGALAMLSCSFETASQQIVEIVGERGRIIVPLAFVALGDCRVHVIEGGTERIETVPAADPYALQAAAMERLIRAGEPVLTPGADAVPTQAVIAAWKQGR
jgi:xylose dehydrogenase (NAD/NADP)